MEEFRSLVLRWVRLIPKGKVLTYGDVAALAGAPGAARRVGTILRGLRGDEEVPWQRVVNAAGGLSTYKIGAGELQRALLEAEGVPVDAERRVALRRHRWRPDEAWRVNLPSC